MKYPKKYEGEKTHIHFPVNVGKYWICSKLLEDGSTEKTGIATYEEEAHCWRPCLAHNKRVGYTEKEVKKIIKKLYNVEKRKIKKDKKQKKEKAKKRKKFNRKRFFSNKP